MGRSHEYRRRGTSRVEVLMGDADGCEYYKDVIHPARILRRGRGKHKCQLDAFRGDPVWGVDEFPLTAVYEMRSYGIPQFKKNAPVEFCWRNRRVRGLDVDCGERVWVRGRMLIETENEFLVCHLDWETQRYTAKRWVLKRKCRVAHSAPGEY